MSASTAVPFTAPGTKAATELNANGDLIFEGWAATWDRDRQLESFEPSAFDRGLKTFMRTNPIVLFSHQYEKALGQITEAEIVPSKGLWVRGRIDKPAPGSWAEDIVAKIAAGTLRSMSVGGIFHRRMTSDGPRIYDVDLNEISIASVPVNREAVFSVITGKALEGKAIINGDVIDALDERVIAVAEKLEQLKDYKSMAFTETVDPDRAWEDRQRHSAAARAQAKEWETGRVDGVINPGATVEVSPAALFTGNVPRDQYGQPIRSDVDFRADQIYADEDGSTALVAGPEEARIMIAGRLPEAPVEPSVEEIFAGKAAGESNPKIAQMVRRLLAQQDANPSPERVFAQQAREAEDKEREGRLNDVVGRLRRLMETQG
jgi:HK97 family phage prohead protease